MTWHHNEDADCAKKTKQTKQIKKKKEMADSSFVSERQIFMWTRTCGQLSTVFLIVLQPQMELLKLGTEKGVHILHAEGGGSVFGEAPPSCPGR